MACWGAVGRRVDSCRAECYSGVKICRDISDQTEGDCQGTVGDQPEMARKQLQREKKTGWEAERNCQKITLVRKTEMLERSTKGMPRRAFYAYYALFFGRSE